MKKTVRFSLAFIIVAGSSVILSSFNSYHPNFNMPWKKAGLTERQAAAHLLDRFTFGSKPGQIDEVVKKGLENWFAEQLDGKLNDDALNERLKEYDALSLSNEQVLTTFPRNAKILRQAIEEGVISKDSVDKSDKEAYRDKVKEYMEQKGYRPQKELYRQFANQKILTAAYSNNQLQQVLTEFWFNHFNVSATKNDCAQFIPAFERDVIRPNVAGKFNDLLLATAQSPAMLFYLDNFNSSGKNAESEAQEQKRRLKLEKQVKEVMDGNADDKEKMMEQLKKRKKEQDLNENYAREVMELHTLGVDGGYTQADVTEAARVLTGWTVYPLKDLGPSNFARKLIEKFGEENLLKRGFVHKGDFFFAMNRHDDKEKRVLGKTFAAGGGYEEGVELINMLANHSSTAKFISKKLAVRFVSDNPPQPLIDKLAAAFTKSEGNIKEVLMTMVAAPEFWKTDVIREKTKSPFELTISAVRALDANVEAPFMLYQWIAKMGQKLYYYQAPTGFPDKGQYWINTGSLLNRMKFGLAFASQKIPGVSFNLAALNNNHEPESAVDALKKYSAIIMPERNLEATIKRLEPMINDPSIQQKIETAADKNTIAATATIPEEKMMTNDEGDVLNDKNKSEEKLAKKMLKKNNGKEVSMPVAAGNNSMLAQVVGIILGSPEFQRR
ncbi:MAG TPA: DUF1800 domain-containing protein [Ferruginibacter sp.]|nr:DUF1800 domain-containing protein [Ferruginibacter sp.]HPH91554.1 DUF1800 domain-containing protein [Ferruginibacter sp.]